MQTPPESCTVIYFISHLILSLVVIDKSIFYNQGNRPFSFGNILDRKFTWDILNVNTPWNEGYCVTEHRQYISK